MDAVRKTDRSAARAATVATLRLTARAKAAIHREALDFVCERYALEESQRDALAAIPIRWRRGRGASAYYPRRAHGFAGPHILLRVAPGASARWHTYRRARARFTTPPGGIELATRTLAAAVLVHELTHALQSLSDALVQALALVGHLIVVRLASVVLACEATTWAVRHDCPVEPKPPTPRLVVPVSSGTSSSRT